MISVIISTHNPVFFESISKNIHETIGVEFEIIGIENNAQYSLCKAYNIGESKAKYPYLCFVHEDVLFRTNNWGLLLSLSMETDNSIGLIGVAGTKFKSSYPNVGWGVGQYLSKLKRGHIAHRNNDGSESYMDYDQNTQKLEVDEVVCVDGVFLFSKQTVFDLCRFDDELLTDYHAYDIDFSLQVFFQSYKVLVDRRINLLHFSTGKYSRQYTLENRKVWKKWRTKLPVGSANIKGIQYKKYYYDFLSWYSYLSSALKRSINISK